MTYKQCYVVNVMLKQHRLLLMLERPQDGLTRSLLIHKGSLMGL